MRVHDVECEGGRTTDDAPDCGSRSRKGAGTTLQNRSRKVLDFQGSESSHTKRSFPTKAFWNRTARPHTGAFIQPYEVHVCEAVHQ